MAKKGTGWCYRDSHGRTTCRSCGRFLNNKPKPECGIGHNEAYRKSHQPCATKRDNTRTREHIRELRQQALQQISPVCQICGLPTRLELAHKFYWPDSAKPCAGTLTRAKEAILHPERFYALCYLCHKTYDRAKKYTGIDIILERKLHTNNITLVCPLLGTS